MLLIAGIVLLSSFATVADAEKQPRTISRTVTLVDSRKVERTIIVFNANTSREDVIQTCSFLANENVQLTFNKLTIGRSFLGILGKQRIRIAEGKIQLADGSTQEFKAGGITSFKSLSIQYSREEAKQSSRIDMIEIIE